MLLVLIVLSVFATVTAVAIGVRKRSGASAMESRIQDFRSRSAVGYEDEVDLDRPFVERVLRPGVEGIARAMASVLPASVLADLQKQLIMAGNPMKLNAYVAFWAVCMVLFGGLALMIFVTLPGDLLLQKLGMAVVFASVGWLAPRMWLKGKVKAKQKAVLRALPDGLDLITTCVEAGLGLDAALSRVAEKSSGPLADDITRTLRDMAMGKLRRDALAELGERNGVEELSNFINSVIQAEQLGVGIAQVLRVQSEQLRTKRRQRAEQAAHEAPIKMLFPLVLFIFPAFLLVILGPAAIRISDTLMK
ncbi:MAG: type II secretion system F family protein [Dehalococcoidia bacterium]|nr:type II secretion system F family protein [Dehalococcoidia bacterium]